MTFTITVVAETGSTNADLLAAARAGAGEGVWLRAVRQRAGRGRQGRAWQDAAGNLFASTILRVGPDDPPAAGLALVAGIALHRTVSHLLDRVSSPAVLMLKWPNDLLLDGAKLAGILLEREGDAVIAGFGVNLAHAPDVPGRTTAALAALTGPVDPDAFCRALAATLAALVAEWRKDEWSAILDEWQARAHSPGTVIESHDSEGRPITGRFGGLDRDGSLVLRMADGTCRTMNAGEIRLMGEN